MCVFGLRVVSLRLFYDPVFLRNYKLMSRLVRFGGGREFVRDFADAKILGSGYDDDVEVHPWKVAKSPSTRGKRPVCGPKNLGVDRKVAVQTMPLREL
jgi:hypothetical protein